MLAEKEISCFLLIILGLSQVQLAQETKLEARRAESTSIQYQSICYPELGCFNNRPPFNNTDKIPESPEKISVDFHLYTRGNAPGFDSLNYTNNSTIPRSNFSASKKTKIIIHGFNGHIGTSWYRNTRDAFLAKGDFNVLLVGWGDGAKFPHYEQAVANIRLVAVEVKMVLDAMVGNGLDLADVHIIGHSLGAHMAGLIGHMLGGKIGRITGLDPAQPNFENLHPSVRLDPSDAQFVDVVHTDTREYNVFIGGYGMEQPSGHVDIYVNGGQTQPGCPEALGGLLDHIWNSPDITHGYGRKIACSHDRAMDVFTASIREDCSFTSYPCPNYAQFEKGECLTCGQGCSSLGYLADQMPGRGVQYVNTLPGEPYCGKMYAMEIGPHSRPTKTYGTLYMAVVGESNESNFTRVTPLNSQLRTSTPIHHIAVFENVGKPKAIKAKYVKTDKLLTSGKKEVEIGDVQLKDLSTGAIFRSCSAPHKLESDNVEEISFADDCVPIG